MPQVVVDIRSAEVIEEKRGDYTFKHQVGKLLKADGDVITFQVSLPRGKDGYPVGRYELGPETFEVDQYKRLRVSPSVYLVPLPPPASK